MPSPTRVEIIDNEAAGRYELRHDDRVVGVVNYRITGNVFVISHVEVRHELRGHGHSAPFLDAVLDLIESTGMKVQPLCSYARIHMESQPERASLLA